MRTVKVTLSYFSVLFLLWLWLDSCHSLTDSSLPEIFYPFGTDEGDSVVNVGHNTFAGEIEIPYKIFNYNKIYVSSLVPCACKAVENRSSLLLLCSSIIQSIM